MPTSNLQQVAKGKFKVEYLYPDKDLQTAHDFIDHVELFATDTYVQLDLFNELKKLGDDSTIQRQLVKRIKLSKELLRRISEQSLKLLSTMDKEEKPSK